MEIKNNMSADSTDILSLSIASGIFIGKLCRFGSLFDGYLEYNFGCSKAVFYKENSEYRIFNNSKKENSVLTLSFQSDGRYIPKTVIIPGMWEYNLTKQLHANSLANNSRIFLTGRTYEYKSNDDSYIAAVRIRVNNISFGEKEYKKINDYMAVKMGQDKISIRPLNGVSILSLNHVQLNGSGESRLILRRILLTPVSEGDIELILPCGFDQGYISDIDILYVMQIDKILSNQRLFRSNWNNIL